MTGAPRGRARFVADPRRLVPAYRSAMGQGVIDFASPQVALVGGFLLAYGVSLVAARDAVEAHAAATVGALVLGLIGLLVGIALVWRPSDLAAARHVALIRVEPRRLTVRLAAALVLLGTVAIGVYLLKIGQLPILMDGAEQGRVIAAMQGGAPLRVLSLLALPGCWLLVALAFKSPRRALSVAAIASVFVTFVLQIATANRAPAFTLVETSVVTALLASGREQLSRTAFAALGAVALALVVLAGIVGALRLASTVSGQLSPAQYVSLTGEAVSGYLRVPVQNLGYTLDAVPEHIGFRLGYTYLQPIVTILPGRQTTFDQDLKAALGQTYAGGGTVPGILGESYANFGVLGWILVPLLLSAWLTWLQRTVRRIATPEAQTLYAYAIVHALGAVLGGLLVASPFPVVAYGILSGLVLMTGRGGAAPASRGG